MTEKKPKSKSTTTEGQINKIFKKADELRKLLNFPEEHTQVRLSRWHKVIWNLEVRPSLVTFGTHTHIMQRGYHGKILNKVLSDALKGANEELELYKEGKTRGIP